MTTTTLQPHGTDARYTGGCRCEDCKGAHAAHQRAYRAAHGQPGRVSVGPAQAHVQALRTQGLFLPQIAAEAGVSMASVRVVANGQPGTRCNRTTAEAILAVPLDPEHVPAPPAPEAPDAQTLRDRASTAAFIRRIRAVGRRGVPA